MKIRSEAHGEKLSLVEGNTCDLLQQHEDGATCPVWVPTDDPMLTYGKIAGYLAVDVSGGYIDVHGRRVEVVEVTQDAIYSAIREAASTLGRRGGAVTGPSKRRGDAAHYSALARSAATESITATNDFHGTSVTLRPQDGWLSLTQVRRARRALCPSPDCQCGGALGERGRQAWDYTDARADGTVRVAPRS